MMPANREISLTQETVRYHWNNVPEVKYDNWLRLRGEQNIFDTENFTAPGYPWMLQIEPTNLCNLSCPFCPSGRKEDPDKRRRHMTLKEFRSIIDDMERYLLFAVLWDWGEPFMNPELPEMIRYASAHDVRTATCTNGHFLQDEAYVERILNSGLSTLVVAIDSLNEEYYLRHRTGGDLAKAVSGLEKLVELKKRVNSKTLIDLRMVVMKDNEKELPEMIGFARKIRVDKFTVKTVNPGCGVTSMDGDGIPENPECRQEAGCTKVWKMANVLANGDVVPCCYDFSAEMKVGNINEKPLTRIWNGPEYRELRKNIFFKKKRNLKCRVCTVSYPLAVGARFPGRRDFHAGAIRQATDYIYKLRKFVLQ